MDMESSTVQRLAETCPKTIRKYAEDILEHTLKVNRTSKLEEQVAYIKERTGDLLLTPVERTILEEALKFKTAEFEGDVSPADQKAIRRLLGCTRLSTLKLVQEELGDTESYSDVVFYCWSTMNYYLTAKQESLTFSDLMRQYSYEVTGVQVQPGTWLK